MLQVHSYAALSLATAVGFGAFTVACGEDEASLSGPAASTGAGGTSTSAGNGGAQVTGAGAGTVASTTVSTGNGGNDAAGGAMGTGGDGGTDAAGGGPGDYPAGPYGNEVGDTFPLLVWEGYVSTDPAALATTEDFTETYTPADVHSSGSDYALIHTALSS